MLTASELDSLCAARIALGEPCPAATLAREGAIDLATYAEHRITAKERIREARDDMKRRAQESSLNLRRTIDPFRIEHERGQALRGGCGQGREELQALRR